MSAPFTSKLNSEIHGLQNEVGRLNRSIAETEKVDAAKQSLLVERVSQAGQQASLVGSLVECVSQAEQQASLVGSLVERVSQAEQQASLVGSLVERVSQAEQQAILVGSLVERVSQAEQQASLIGSLVERVSQAEQQAFLVEQRSRELVSLQSSTSWQLTRSLRSLKRSARSAAIWPKTKTRYVLEHALAWLRRRPRTKALVKGLLHFVSPLERRFLAFSRMQTISIVDVDTGWTLEPDRQIMNEWRELLRLPCS